MAPAPTTKTFYKNDKPRKVFFEPNSFIDQANPFESYPSRNSQTPKYKNNEWFSDRQAPFRQFGARRKSFDTQKEPWVRSKNGLPSSCHMKQDNAKPKRYNEPFKQPQAKRCGMYGFKNVFGFDGKAWYKKVSDEVKEQIFTETVGRTNLSKNDQKKAIQLLESEAEPEHEPIDSTCKSASPSNVSMQSDESELEPESIEETVKVGSTVHTPKN